MIRQLWPICIGFGLWALAFIGLYALQYFGCYLGWDPAAHRAVLILGYVASLAILGIALVFQILRLRKSGQSARPIDRIGTGATIAALAATAITYAPTLLVSACI